MVAGPSSGGGNRPTYSSTNEPTPELAKRLANRPPVSDEHIKTTIEVLLGIWEPQDESEHISFVAADQSLPSIRQAYLAFLELPKNHPLKQEYTEAQFTGAYLVAQRWDPHAGGKNYKEIHRHMTNIEFHGNSKPRFITAEYRLSPHKSFSQLNL